MTNTQPFATDRLQPAGGLDEPETLHEPWDLVGHGTDAIWSHFRLRAQPFSLTPDPAVLYFSQDVGEALAALQLSILARQGLMLLTGEVGTGKTTIAYTLLSKLGPEIATAYVSNTSLGFDEILEQALGDFGVAPLPKGARRVELLETLNRFLADTAFASKIAVLVIDEAQNLSREGFEQIRLLLNFESYSGKLLQILLVGQPELDEMLAQRSLRQVADRIATRCRLRPLGRTEVPRYVGARLRAAGGDGRLFSSNSLRLIAQHSRGIPRRINVLCHSAMLFAFGAGATQVSSRHVTRVVRQLRPPASTRWRRKLAASRGPILAAAASFLTAVVATAFFLGWPERGSEPTADAQRVAAPTSAAAEPMPTGSPESAPLLASSSSRGGVTGETRRRPIEEGATLYGILVEEYGTYDSYHLRRVLEANPYIEDPSHLQVGWTLVLPADRTPPAFRTEAATSP